jgi:hypothetical protein
MFEAGRKSFAAFSSNKTRPLSSETTLIPTISDDNSGFASTSEIFARNSGSVFGPGAGDGAGCCATAAEMQKSRNAAIVEALRLYIQIRL